MEQPDIVIGIHPGLHAEGVYEFWEPTLELLLDKNVKTAFTVLSEEEYVQARCCPAAAGDRQAFCIAQPRVSPKPQPLHKCFQCLKRKSKTHLVQ